MDPATATAVEVLPTLFSGGSLAVIVAIFFELRSIRGQLTDHAKDLEALSQNQKRGDRITAQLGRRLSYVIGRMRWPDNSDEIEEDNGKQTVV